MTTADDEVTTANAGPLAPFRYQVQSDTWWWSDQAFGLFGFAPGEVLPTTELILRHQHPTDAEPTAKLVRSLLDQRRGFCVWHRIVDARERTRQLLTIGEGVWDESGTLTEIRGSFLDLTRVLRRTLGRDIDEAVRASAMTRAAIEQAKGVLMLTQRVSAEQAFEVLRHSSQATNVKVRDLAASVMSAVVETGKLPSTLLDHLEVAYDGHGNGRSDGRADGVGRLADGVGRLADGVVGDGAVGDGHASFEGEITRVDGRANGGVAGPDADPVG